MTFRRSSLFAFATLLAASAALPALAGDWQSGGIPLAGSNTTNSLEANNVAAGIGNGAFQSIHSNQTGAPVPYMPQMFSGKGKVSSPQSPLVTNNTTVGTNVAAGIGNLAGQTLGVNQGGATGRNVSNSLNALNLAAGIGNFAGQNIHANQK